MIILLGTNGTGKTTLIEKFVKAEKNRALVVSPDDRDWHQLPLIMDLNLIKWDYTRARRYIWSGPEDLAIISRKFHNGTLVFDDCRSYLKANLDERVRRLLIRRRQNQVDIFVAAHGFTEVPPKFFTFCTEIVLFKTLDNIHARKDVIRNFDKVKAFQEYVNTQSDKEIHFCDYFKY